MHHSTRNATARSLYTCARITGKCIDAEIILFALRIRTMARLRQVRAYVLQELVLAALVLCERPLDERTVEPRHAHLNALFLQVFDHLYGLVHLPASGGGSRSRLYPDNFEPFISHLILLYIASWEAF